MKGHQRKTSISGWIKNCCFHKGSEPPMRKMMNDPALPKLFRERVAKKLYRMSKTKTDTFQYRLHQQYPQYF